jgi:hypothetical protein
MELQVGSRVRWVPKPGQGAPRNGTIKRISCGRAVIELEEAVPRAKRNHTDPRFRTVHLSTLEPQEEAV